MIANTVFYIATISDHIRLYNVFFIGQVNMVNESVCLSVCLSALSFPSRTRVSLFYALPR